VDCAVTREFQAAQLGQVERLTREQMEHWAGRLSAAMLAPGDASPCAFSVRNNYAMILRELGQHQESLGVLRDGILGTTVQRDRLMFGNYALGVLKLIHMNVATPAALSESRAVALEALEGSPTLHELHTRGETLLFSYAFPLWHCVASTEADPAVKDALLLELLSASTADDEAAALAGRHRSWSFDRVAIAKQLFDLRRAQGTLNDEAGLNGLLSAVAWEVEGEEVMGLGRLLNQIVSDTSIPRVVRENLVVAHTNEPERQGVRVRELGRLLIEHAHALPSDAPAAEWAALHASSVRVIAACDATAAEIAAGRTPPGLRVPGSLDDARREALYRACRTAYWKLRNCELARPTATRLITLYPESPEAQGAARVLDKCGG
jgi:hypothetical protein